MFPSISIIKLNETKYNLQYNIDTLSQMLNNSKKLSAIFSCLLEKYYNYKLKI